MKCGCSAFRVIDLKTLRKSYDKYNDIKKKKSIDNFANLNEFNKYYYVSKKQNEFFNFFKF